MLDPDVRKCAESNSKNRNIPSPSQSIECRVRLQEYKHQDRLDIESAVSSFTPKSESQGSILNPLQGRMSEPESFTYSSTRRWVTVTCMCPGRYFMTVYPTLKGILLLICIWWLLRLCDICKKTIRGAISSEEQTKNTFVIEFRDQSESIHIVQLEIQQRVI